MLKRFAAGDEQTIAALRQYWDAQLSGNPAREPSSLDLELAATVQQIHRQDDALTASPEFASTLLEQLMGILAAVQAVPPAPSEQPAARSGPVTISPTRPSPVRAGLSRTWAVMSAGSVLLLVLAIAAGFFIWNGNQKPAPAIIPLYTETTADGVLIQTILEEHVAAGMLPGDPTKWIASFKFSLEPGEAWRDQPIGCEMSRQYVVGVVESGTLAMINTGPFEVTRADGTAKSIQAGERADLQAGDSWVYLSDRTEMNLHKWNPGMEPMVAYQTDWALDASCESTPSNPEWHWHNSTFGAEFDPSRPVVATFEQVFVQPGATLSQDDATAIGFVAGDSSVFRVIGIESGKLLEAWVPDALMQGETPRDDSDQAYAFTSGQVWTDAAFGSSLEGKERVLRAGDDEPLVLTVIAWSYAEIQGTSESSGADAAAEIERSTLVDLHFAADVVPRDADSVIVINRAVVPAGESVAYPEACGPPMLVAAAVESGSLAVMTESAVDITRSDGSIETIEPPTLGFVHEGDSLIYSNAANESLSGFSNPGPGPLSILQAIWFPKASCSYGQVGSIDRSQTDWITYDRLRALESPMAFAITLQHITAPNFSPMLDAEILGSPVPRNPSDNLALMIVESGTVEEQLLMIEGSKRTTESRAVHESGAIVSLDDSLTFGNQYERQLMGQGVEPLELTVITIVYEPDSS